MSQEESKELNIRDIAEQLKTTTANLDAFAQAVGKDTDDPVLRARMTQCIVLCGTALEIISGIIAQADAAAAVQANAESEATESDSDIDG